MLKDFKIFFVILGVIIIFSILLITYKLDNMSSTKKEKKNKNNAEINYKEPNETLTEDDLYEGIRDEYNTKSDYYDYLEEKSDNSINAVEEDSAEKVDNNEINIFSNNYLEENDSNEPENNVETKKSVDIFSEELQEKEENISFDQTMVFNTIKEEEVKKEEVKQEYDPFIEQLKNFKEPEQSDTTFFTTAPTNTKKRKKTNSLNEEDKKEVEIKEEKVAINEEQTQVSKKKIPKKVEENDFLNEMEKTLMKNRNTRKTRRTVMTTKELGNLEKTNSIEESKGEKNLKKKVENEEKSKTTKKNTKSKKTKEE